MVGLRTKWGVKLHELLELCSPGPDWYEQVESFKTSGKLVEASGALVLTESGRLLADAIAAELFLLPD
jgi:coproporphyrinogen III oxidase-like Fe-S oxidoreductase